MIRILVLALTLIFTVSSPAFAHKLKVFAAVVGENVSGYAYFKGGSRARGVLITAGAVGEKPFFQGKTGEDGSFAFQLKQPGDVLISADSGDGHVATWTLGPMARPSAPPPVTASADINAMIEQSVARQVIPLREQIEAYHDKILLNDVLGGIGYIVGIFGLVFGLLNRKKSV